MTDKERELVMRALMQEISSRKKSVADLGVQMGRPIFGNAKHDLLTVVCACLGIATCYAEKCLGDLRSSREYVLDVLDAFSRMAIAGDDNFKAEQKVN